VDKVTVLKILSSFAASLENQGIRVDRLILYGSYANGNWHEGSDIDVVVISPDFVDMDFWERIRVLGLSMWEVFEPIEPVAMTPEEWASGRSMIVDYASKGEVVCGHCSTV
jgi:predicted nucleotidyltransferase